MELLRWKKNLLKVVKGIISSPKENNRLSDNSAKYHVEVHVSKGNLHG